MIRPPEPAPGPVPDPRPTRADLARALVRDADLHEAGRIAGLGEGFGATFGWIVDGDPAVAIAQWFWSGWLEERDRGFRGAYEGLGAPDWPRHARDLACVLQCRGAVGDDRVLRHFAPPEARGLGDQLEALFRRHPGGA